MELKWDQELNFRDKEHCGTIFKTYCKLQEKEWGHC